MIKLDRGQRNIHQLDNIISKTIDPMPGCLQSGSEIHSCVQRLGHDPIRTEQDPLGSSCMNRTVRLSTNIYETACSVYHITKTRTSSGIIHKSWMSSIRLDSCCVSNATWFTIIPTPCFCRAEHDSRRDFRKMVGMRAPRIFIPSF